MFRPGVFLALKLHFFLTKPVANQGGVSENSAFGFYYAIYYAILFFTTLFTTLREAPANDLYVFWQIPKRQYGSETTALRFP